jgi:phosphatidylethanolamine-binding protein (PEBP) family uncharacterized protein
MTFSFPNSSTTKYIVIALDIDAPFQSLPILGPILHWIQPGFITSSAAEEDGGNNSNNNNNKLSTSEPFVANYIGPAPPPGSGPHRYCFFVYEQPAGFDVAKHAPANGAKVGNGARMWASLDDKVKEFGLGELLAFNYFTSN